MWFILFFPLLQGFFHRINASLADHFKESWQKIGLRSRNDRKKHEFQKLSTDELRSESNFSSNYCGSLNTLQIFIPILLSQLYVENNVYVYIPILVLAGFSIAVALLLPW